MIEDNHPSLLGNISVNSVAAADDADDDVGWFFNEL